MVESKKKQKATEPMRKLSLQRETLRTLQEADFRQIEGVAGGISTIIVITIAETNPPTASIRLC
ncbi:MULTISPECIES: hypothetical protein [Myxococcus]|uniref:hypothetical protein n=1 Tax=Myxococcus TaxID=32 RepID=UPI00112E4DC5|nr:MULTISPECIES: hypothetical protein [Myxococcus]QDE81873.1 hypothetical protein BHS07_10115 [Myxococcus xanthus]WAM28584.1 hypothetical protein OZ403_10930 [Myxococcus sp. NMCA1]